MEKQYKKRYFIVSDIHGFYDEFMNSLNAKGYNKDNPNHVLVVLGDCFDRGTQNKKVFEFLTSIPEDNIILIRGNHEDLLMEMIDRNDYYTHDINNGTLSTVCEFVNVPEYYGHLEPQLIFKTFRGHPVWEWLNSDKWKSYLELGNFILTHAFIPLKEKYRYAIYNNILKDIEYFKEWRTESTPEMWRDSRWGCPYSLISVISEEDLGDTIFVCGHWTTNDFHKQLNNDTSIFNHNIYYGEHLIAIDGCTVHSGVVNVLTIDEHDDGSFTIVK